jgi:D-glycero-alpha-D-manno-heptose-7-phosphate kinase
VQLAMRDEAPGHAPGDAPDDATDAAAEPPLARAALRRAGLPELRATVTSDFPVGAGLGGSSAVGVALAAALAAWREEARAPGALAEWSRAVEVDELGIAGGRQDHYAAALGGALGLRFAADGVTVRRLRPSDATLAALERRCVVAYTGEARVSARTITGVLDAYRAGDARVCEALARMAALAERMADALEAGRLDDLGLLVGEHWAWQRALHPAIPTPAIDALLERARAAGALGGKALGASGGGCVLAIAPDDRVDAVRAAMAALAEPLDFAVDRAGVTVDAAGTAAP